MNMKAKTILLSLIASFFFLATAAFAQGNFEIGGHVGGQLNGGIDITTALYRRLDAGNALSYGLTVGYLLGEHYGVEFQWTRSTGETRAEPTLGGSSVRLFDLTQDHYLGNFLLHFSDREAHFRPYVSFGLGANNMSANRSGVASNTQFTFAIGGGAKYNLSKHLGLRGQLQYVPTYLYSTNNGGYWCDPFWGGCWAVGNSHYLNSLGANVGVTLRF
jgi:opacity protein-like surface antigen